MSGNLAANARFFEYGSYGPAFAINNNRRQISATKANEMTSPSYLGWDPYTSVDTIGTKYTGTVKTDSTDRYVEKEYVSDTYSHLVFYIIKPTNISVLPAGAVSAKIRALQNTLSAQAGVELLAMNSRESFNATCLFYHDRMQEEKNPAIRSLLEQDRAFLDEKQVQMTLAREFYLAVRLKNEKPDTAYTLLSTIETKFRDNGFTTRRAGKEDLKRLLAIYFEQNTTTERFEDYDGQRFLEVV